MRPRLRDLWIPFALAAALALPVSASAAYLAVTTLADVDAMDGDCSLREAIVAANTDAAYQDCPAGAGADVIKLTVAGTIVLVADLAPIEQELTLRGRGADESAIDGADAFVVLHFEGIAPGNGEVLRIEDLRLTRGRGHQGGAVFIGIDRGLEVVACVLDDNRSTLDGGAIFAAAGAEVTIARSTLVGNSAGNGGGALAILFGDTATVVDTTFATNVAEGGPGGAIYALNTDSLLVHQATVSNNVTAADGGGVAAVVTPIRLESSTVVGNQADSAGVDGGDGGGLSVAGAVIGTLASSVVAGNLDASVASVCPDVLRKLGAGVVTEGFNLIGINTCVAGTFPAGQPNINSDQVGTAAAPIDPLLAPLDDNGGPTATHLPLAGSPTIDQGSCPAATTDQRGFGMPSTATRPVDDPAVPDLAGGCDVGALEVGGVAFLVFADDLECGDMERWSEVATD